MNSEVKLNQLFAALQCEQATTDISDVTSWIQTAAAGNAGLKTSEKHIQKNNTMVEQLKGVARFYPQIDLSAWLNVRTILTTAVSAALIGGMFVLTDND